MPPFHRGCGSEDKFLIATSPSSSDDPDGGLSARDDSDRGGIRGPLQCLGRQVRPDLPRFSHHRSGQETGPVTESASFLHCTAAGAGQIGDDGVVDPRPRGWIEIRFGRPALQHSTDRRGHLIPETVSAEHLHRPCAPGGVDRRGS